MTPNSQLFEEAFHDGMLEAETLACVMSGSLNNSSSLGPNQNTPCSSGFT